MDSSSRRADRRVASRRLRHVAGTVALAALQLDCSAILDRDRDQCRTSADCQHLAAGAVCTASGVCESVKREMGGAELPYSCTSDAECGTGLCILDRCFDFEALGCSVLSKPYGTQRLPMAALLPDSTLDATRIETALRVSLDGWNAQQPELPLLGVACDAAQPAHREALAEAGFPIVLAATGATELEVVLESLDERALVFAPFAEAPLLPELVAAGDTSLVSCKPNRGDSIDAILAAASLVGGRSDARDAGSRAVIALSHDEERFGYADFVATTSRTSGEPLVYEWDELGVGLVSALESAAAPPGVLIGLSGEVDWAKNISAVEVNTAWNEAPRPFYVIADRRPNLLASIAQNAEKSPLYQRTFLLDYHTGAKNQEVRAGFDEALENATPSTGGADLQYVHDCFYVAAYAALATQLRYAMVPQRLSGRALLIGLRALTGGEPLPVGPGHIATGRAALLATRGGDATLDLFGGSGELDFEGLPEVDTAALSRQAVYLAPRTAESAVFCSDSKRKPCETGVTISPEGEIRGVDRCSCLALP